MATRSSNKPTKRYYYLLIINFVFITAILIVTHWHIIPCHHLEQHDYGDAPQVITLSNHALSTGPLSSQNSDKQQQQQQQQQQRLEFVHIPKTGGSSIETIASKKNISWGLCKFLMPDSSLENSNGAIECPGTSKFAQGNGRNSTFAVHKIPGLLPPPELKCATWHLPSYFFDSLHPNHNPYYNADLFAVVRSPYTRLISEYYYRGIYLRMEPKEKLNDPENMNQWLKKILLDRLKFLDHPYPWGEKGYCSPHQGHLIPQRQFVYHGHRKVVDHVLYFENLTEEFDQLMIMYGYNLTMQRSKRVYETKHLQLGVENFTSEVRGLVEQVYKQDFETFHYPYHRPTEMG